MKVEFEPEGNTTFIFPYDGVDVAESFLAEVIRYYASIGISSEGAFEILKALHDNRMKHLQ